MFGDAAEVHAALPGAAGEGAGLPLQCRGLQGRAARCGNAACMRRMNSDRRF